MSFYDEVKRNHMAAMDIETGIPKSERDTLDTFIEICKDNILRATRVGNTHIVLKYSSHQLRYYTDETKHSEALFYYLLDNCVHVEKYAKAKQLIIYSLGSEFDLEVSFDNNGNATVYIQWESPNKKEMEN